MPQEVLKTSEQAVKGYKHPGKEEKQKEQACSSERGARQMRFAESCSAAAKLTPRTRAHV
jgi:hypothetical protein